MATICQLHADLRYYLCLEPVDMRKQFQGLQGIVNAEFGRYLTQDEVVLSWLESHLVMIPMEPRRPGCSVVEGKDVTEEKVKALAAAADRCWEAILARDLEGFAKAYKDSFNAQTAMFPGMVKPMQSLGLRVEGSKLDGKVERGLSIQEYIDRWSKVPGVLAWKMPGAGGGGYLACVVEDAKAFCKEYPEAIALTIRRSRF